MQTTLEKEPKNYPSMPIQGCGIGLRIEHFDEIEQDQPDIPWLEILSDNYLLEGTSQRDYLYKVRENYPLTFHGVGRFNPASLYGSCYKASCRSY